MPLICSGIGFLVLAAVLAVIMPECNFSPTPREERETFRHLITTARNGLALARSRRVVRSLLLVSIFVGLSAEAFDRLWQLRILQEFPLPHLLGPNQKDAGPYVWFALIELVGVTLALICSLVINRLRLEQLNAAHPHRILALLALVQVAGIAALALAGWLWLALVAVWLKAAASALASPITSAWMNRNLEPGVRTTVLSFQSQAGALGELAGGPPLGLLGRRTSVPVALLGSAALLFPSVAIRARLRPDRVAQPEPVAPLEVLDQRPESAARPTSER